MSDFDDKSATRLTAVGHVDSRSARLWMRSPHSGDHEIRLSRVNRPTSTSSARIRCDAPGECDGTYGFTWPDDFPGMRPLEARTEYRYEILDPDGRAVGDGSFETSPCSQDEAPDSFSILVASCNQPFDDAGNIRRESLCQLDCAAALCEDYAVKRVILLGDQMYADYPQTLSLFDEAYFAKVAPPGRETIFDCTRAEVRRLYQGRYRTFWQTSAFQRLQQNAPSYAIPDDHEIHDNFGSAPEHAGPEWRNIREGALDACFDYQTLRMAPRCAERPPSLHCAFDYGPVAAFMMDLRSQKCADTERIVMYGDSQLDALRAFLSSHGDRAVLLLGLSVPLVHVPDWLATLGARFSGEDSDAADRWSYEKATASRDELVTLLTDHQARYPGQKLILLGGDVHCGVVSELNWIRPRLHAWQLVSSAVSNLESAWFRRIAEAAPRLGAQFRLGNENTVCEMNLLEGEESGRNPYGGLNMGIVQMLRRGSEWKVRLRLIGHDDKPRPKLVFSTVEL